MQRINLLPVEADYSNVPFSFRQMLLASMAGLGLLVLITLALFSQSLFATKKNQALSTRKQTLNQEITEKQQQIFSAKDKAKFTQQIDSLQAKQIELNKILITLRALNIEETSGFSEYLTALSRHTRPGLWLTHFELLQGGRQVRLIGQTIDTEFIPRLIQDLGQDSVFAGKKFDKFEVNQAQASDGTVSISPASQTHVAFKIGSRS